MKKINTKLKILFLIAVFGVFTAISYDLNQYNVYTTPDFTTNIFFSELVSDEYTLKYCNDYNVSIFGGRTFARAKDEGCATHASMHGYILILGIFRMISDSLIYFVNPLFAIISLIFFYKISRLFFNEKTSILGVILLSFSASFFYYSVLYFNNIVLLGFLLGGIYFFFRLLQTNATKYYLLFPLFLSIAIWIRYPVVIFSIPLVIGFFSKEYRKNFYLLNRDENRITIKNSNEKKLLLSAFMFLIMLLPLLLLNIHLYGHPLGWVTTPEMQLSYHIYKGLSPEQTENTSIVPFYGFDIMFNNLKYILKLNSIISIFFIISIVYFLVNKNRRGEIFFCNSFWILMSITVFYFLFYLGNTWTGYYYTSFSINTSLARYLLPVYAIMILLSSYIISSLFKYDWVRINKILTITLIIILLTAYITFNLNLVVNEDLGLNSIKSSVSKYVYRQNIILDVVPEKDAVIFTKYSDKWIFPERITAIYVAFPPETRMEQTSILVKKLLIEGVPVYFVDEDWLQKISGRANVFDNFTTKEYLSEFEKNDMSQRLVSKDVYKIELKNNTQ